MGWYLVRQRLAKRERFPLIVELEPLFQCNLACSGCGKIQHPEHELRRRMPVEQAIAAIEESGAPMVSIAGRRAADPPRDPRDRGRARQAQEVRLPVHERAAAGAQARRTSSRARTSPGRSTWTACASATTPRSSARASSTRRSPRSGRPRRRGFRVTTNTTFFTHDSPKTVREVLDFLNDDLEVDEMMISPAYAYEKAPDQEHFLGVQQTRKLFSEAFADGRRKRWRLNHSPLFLDFLEGKAEFDCTAWGIPSYSLFGWQRPCYLMADGYTADLQRAASRRPTGARTGAAGTRAARTAWPTAATSPPRCCRRRARCASHCARSSARRRRGAIRLGVLAAGCPARAGPRRAAPGRPARARSATSTACRMMP